MLGSLIRMHYNLLWAQGLRGYTDLQSLGDVLNQI